MPDCMMPFPEDWHDFLKDYSFDDSQEVYTNGSRLIPVFRVEQLIKHLLKAQEPNKDWISRKRLKDESQYYIDEAGWGDETNKVLGWCMEFIDNQRAVKWE